MGRGGEAKARDEKEEKERRGEGEEEVMGDRNRGRDEGPEAVRAARTRPAERRTLSSSSSLKTTAWRGSTWDWARNSSRKESERGSKKEMMRTGRLRIRITG